MRDSNLATSETLQGIVQGVFPATYLFHWRGLIVGHHCDTQEYPYILLAVQHVVIYIHINLMLPTLSYGIIGVGNIVTYYTLPVSAAIRYS